jgi:hypothetical protein
LSFDTTTLSGLAWVERTIGHRVALKGYRELASRMVDDSTRARALLGALRCAVRLGEIEDVRDLMRGWHTMRAGVFGDEVIDLCKALVAQGHGEGALALARAEAQRQPAARPLYLYARLLERAEGRGGPQGAPASSRADHASATEVYARAVELADKDPALADLALAARVRRIERLAMDPTTCPQAAIEAAAADPEQASPAQRLVIASGRLLSPSRFTRASGLSILEEVARRARPELAELAVRIAAQHADRFADALSAVEADRIAAALKHWPDPSAREAALARLTQLVRVAAARGDDREQRLASAAESAPETFPLACRARAVLSGGGVGEYPSLDASGAPSPGAAPDVSPTLHLASLGLDAIVALRRRRPSDAAASLRTAQIALAQTGGEAPPPLWAAAATALASRDVSARAAAAALAETLIYPVTGAPPPAAAQISRLAMVLRHAGRGDLAVRALRWAAAAKDVSASEDLALELVRHGWSAALDGERDAAIAALREARALFAQAPATGPKVSGAG